MIRLRHKISIYGFLIFDQLMLIAAAVAILYYRSEFQLRESIPWTQATFRMSDGVGIFLLGAGWLAIFNYCVRYRLDRFVELKTQLKDLVKATTLAAFWLLAISVGFSIDSFNTVNILIFWAIVTSAGVASRLLLRTMLVRARFSGDNSRYLLFVGVNGRARDLVDRIEKRPELGYKIIGFVAESPEAQAEWGGRHAESFPILGQLADLQSILKREKVDEIMICLPLEPRFSDIVRIIQHGRDLGVVVRLFPNDSERALLRNLHIEEFEKDCVITFFRERMLLHLLAKRVLDILVSLTALALLSPLMLVIALIIKATSKGPVFFKQKRVGMNQRQFYLYKFRSMVEDAEQRKRELEHLNEQDGPAFKIRNDPRVTPIGRFIRKTSIDELPQLFNVLRGEMSLVGPRPPLPEEVLRYEWLYRRRLSVKPGITCFWQVSGRNNISFQRWMEMDHEYIDKWSLWLDLKLLLLTVPAVLLSRGAS